ncbi:hypothetical protein [Corynebacterium yudongzhengii]|uniref:hypothetical protein n=1 Tax=Corynebacterium yudongzhengii TaxID=2080740 RepID=UPI001304F7C0|nr:hypothetical protein [Corynebacterium yudongzhengii]
MSGAGEHVARRAATLSQQAVTGIAWAALTLAGGAGEDPAPVPSESASADVQG